MVSSFQHVPFQITLKSKTKRGKCIPGVYGIHARNHKNNTSSGAPFRTVICNIWGNSNEKHCVRKKPKRFVSSLAPFLLSTVLSWVTLMWTRWLKNKAVWLDLILAENRLVGWVGGKGKPKGGECSFIRETQENHISASVSICQGKEGRVEEWGRVRRRYRAG